MSNTAIISATKAAQAIQAFDYAANVFMQLYQDPITITITMAASSSNILGQSSTSLYSFSYSSIRTALQNDRVTADDTTAFNNDVPLSAPVAGTYWVTAAQAAALNLYSPSGSVGTFTFGANQPYTFDPNNRAVAGSYDFIGVVMHEISEILGRIPSLGGTIGTYTPSFMLYDLFRYRAAGVRGITNTGAGNYFSIDNGVTVTRYYNDGNTYGGDEQDWDSATPDACNAFLAAGIMVPLSEVDRVAVDVMGYNRNTAAVVSAVAPNSDPSSRTAQHNSNAGHQAPLAVASITRKVLARDKKN